ncbi:MAG: sigma-70 family RNA polymerase sigma factor [Planctomycetota bacterium]
MRRHLMSAPDDTGALVDRWHRGDQTAIGELMARHLDWVHTYVRPRLRGPLRRKDETQDIVQLAMLEVLKYGPRFRVQSDAHFRGLLARIVRNVLSDRRSWFTRLRRDMHRERGLPDGPGVGLALGASRGVPPPGAADRAEVSDLMRLALELLGGQDRDVIIARLLDGKAFGVIGTELGTSREAVRKRFDRALPKLTRLVKRLRDGDVETLLEERAW